MAEIRKEGKQVVKPAGSGLRRGWEVTARWSLAILATGCLRLSNDQNPPELPPVEGARAEYFMEDDFFGPNGEPLESSDANTQLLDQFNTVKRYAGREDCVASILSVLDKSGEGETVGLCLFRDEGSTSLIVRKHGPDGKEEVIKEDLLFYDTTDSEGKRIFVFAYGEGKSEEPTVLFWDYPGPGKSGFVYSDGREVVFNETSGVEGFAVAWVNQFLGHDPGLGIAEAAYQTATPIETQTPIPTETPAPTATKEFNPNEVDFERDTLYFHWVAESKEDYPRYGLPKEVQAEDMLSYNEFMTQVREIFPDAKNTLVVQTDTKKFGVIATHIVGYDAKPSLDEDLPNLLLQTWSVDGKPIIFTLVMGGSLSPRDEEGNDGENVGCFAISTRGDVLEFISTHTDEYGEYLDFHGNSDQATVYDRFQLREHLKGQVVYLVVEFYPSDPKTDPGYQTGLWLRALIAGGEPYLGDNSWQGREWFYDVAAYSLLIPKDAMNQLLATK